MVKFSGRATARYAVVLCGVLGLAGCVSEPVQTPTFYQNMAQSGAVVDAQTAAQMISQYRRNNGLGPVVADANLTRIANVQAVSMASAGNVKASLKKENALATRMASIGEDGVVAVENVSGGYRTLAEAFSGWRESPNHNAVLLDPNATRLGISTAYSPSAKHKVFWSLVMAAPQKTN